MCQGPGLPGRDIFPSAKHFPQPRGDSCWSRPDVDGRKIMNTGAVVGALGCGQVNTFRCKTQSNDYHFHHTGHIPGSFISSFQVLDPPIFTTTSQGRGPSYPHFTEQGKGKKMKYLPHGYTQLVDGRAGIRAQTVWLQWHGLPPHGFHRSAWSQSTRLVT